MATRLLFASVDPVYTRSSPSVGDAGKGGYGAVEHSKVLGLEG